MSTLVSDIQYFSPYIWFKTLSNCSHCVFEQYDHFEKMTFRSRCTVLGGNGSINLSIPLSGGRNQKTLMKDVQILNSEKWQSRHWKTIISCYSKSPWFDHYRSGLEKVYAQKCEYLVDWNIKCFEWACDKMSIKSDWSLTDTYREIYIGGEFWDWRNKLKPSTINLLFPDVSRYPQVFGDRFGFVPNLSILDYLFCVGGADVTV